MLDILKRFCSDNSTNNGLLLVDMPTGAGKTHFVINYIYNHFEEFSKDGRKLIFVTSLKKNLPINDLRKLFEDSGRSDFDKNVLFLDSNADCLINNFEKVKASIPSDFKEADLFRKINDNIQTINIYKKRLEGKKQETPNEDDFEGLFYLAQKAKETITDELEPRFRRFIESKINRDSEGKRRTKLQKKKLVATELQWVSQLYEAVNTDDATVLFMSLDKFLARNSTIIEPSYVMANSKMVRNAIIFIDEFDACKEVILKNNIDNGIRDRISLLGLFRLIHGGLKNTFTTKLMKPSKELSEEIQEKQRKKTPHELVENLRVIAEQIYSDYSISYFHKLKSVEQKTSFLFQDFKFLTIFDEKDYDKDKPKKEIAIEKNDDEKLNFISIIEADEERSDEDRNLFMLLKRLRSFIEYFAKGVGFIATNYMNNKRKDFADYNYEAAIRTVLAECNIDGRNANYITNLILNSKKGKITKINDLKNDFDSSIYQKGFRYYSLMDADEFDTQSKIEMIDCNESPEKFIIKLASNGKVVGISATATLPTVTGNFNIQYLKEKLGNRYINLTAGESKRIKDYFEHEIIKDYSNVNINLQSIAVNEVNYLTELGELFSDDTTRQQISERLHDLVGKDEYKTMRYVKVFAAMKSFLINEKISSFLCLMNIKAARYKNDFNLDFLRDVFDIFKAYHHASANKCYIRTLDGNLDAFESRKKKLHEELKRGNKIFVLSTYQTLGAGQNLQYQMPEDFYDFVKINDLKYANKNLKDFDGIYLDNPTNVFVNISSEVLDEREFIRFLYHIKFLQYSGQISPLNANIMVRRGFNIFQKKQNKGIKSPECKSIDLHYSRIILQAIGRICRSGVKNSEILICYDESIIKHLANVADEYSKRLLNPEFKKLLEAAGRSGVYDDVEYQEAINAAENIAAANQTEIDAILNNAQRVGAWSYASKENWQALRELVLKYPFINEDNENKGYSIYIRLPKRERGYFYNQDAKTRHIQISFSEKINASETFVGEKACRLPELMDVPGVKEYFVKKGYATKFEPSDYMISPTIFTNIYKGALGEAIGKFLLESHGIVESLQDIEELHMFEKFDYRWNDVYVDFKHWDDVYSYKDNEKELDKIANKLKACNGRKAVIVNILSSSADYKIYSHGDILVVPYLYDLASKKVSIDNLNIIKTFISKD